LDTADARVLMVPGLAVKSVYCCLTNASHDANGFGGVAGVTGAVGLTAFEAADCAPTPTAFLAATLNV